MPIGAEKPKKKMVHSFFVEHSGHPAGYPAGHLAGHPARRPARHLAGHPAGHRAGHPAGHPAGYLAEYPECMIKLNAMPKILGFDKIIFSACLVW